MDGCGTWPFYWSAIRVPNFHIGRIDPQIGPVALDRAVQKRPDPLIDLGAPLRDLALADAAHAHGLDQLVDRAGRDTLDVLGRTAPLPERGAVPDAVRSIQSECCTSVLNVP